jgi:Zn-dependent protease
LNGVITYLCFIPVLTFHEFAHAWTAWKCGDDTAKSQGRVSLNPIVHMELVGTVILPLAGALLSAADSQLARFIIGWGRPVPVDVSNLRNPRRDDTLIALAGPAMNILIAIVLMAGVKLGVILESNILLEMSINLIQVSLMLCFFNLLPIPPLDGSHVIKNMIGMSFETYWRLSQYGFIIVLVVLQVPAIRRTLGFVTNQTFMWIAALYGIR